MNRMHSSGDLGTLAYIGRYLKDDGALYRLRFTDRLLNTCGPGKILCIGSGSTQMSLTFRVRGVQCESYELDAKCRGDDLSCPSIPFDDLAFETVVIHGVCLSIGSEIFDFIIREAKRISTCNIVFDISFGSSESHKGYRRQTESYLLQCGLRKHPVHFSLVSYEFIEYEGHSITIACQKKTCIDLSPKGFVGLDRLSYCDTESDALTYAIYRVTELIPSGSRVQVIGDEAYFCCEIIHHRVANTDIFFLDDEKFPHKFEFNVNGLPPKKSSPKRAAGLDAIMMMWPPSGTNHFQFDIKDILENIEEAGRLFIVARGSDASTFEDVVSTNFLRLPEFVLDACWGIFVKRDGNSKHQYFENIDIESSGRFKEYDFIVISYVKTFKKNEASVAPQEDSKVYTYPSIKKSLVSLGRRITDTNRLIKHANDVLIASPLGSLDQGAALCVLGYRLLESLQSGTIREIDYGLVTKIECFFSLSGENRCRGMLRWHISLSFVLGKIFQQIGDVKNAIKWLNACTTYDPCSVTPLIATKSVRAYYLKGIIFLSMGNINDSKTEFLKGVEVSLKAIAGDISTEVGDSSIPPRHVLPELAEVCLIAAKCAHAANVMCCSNIASNVVWQSMSSDIEVERERLNMAYREIAVWAAELEHWKTELYQSEWAESGLN